LESGKGCVCEELKISDIDEKNFIDSWGQD
jgi:hypothetical protein